MQQAYCRGNNLGHAWLPINGWFIDTLLAHPKGSGAVLLAPVPAGAPVVCSEDAYEAPPLPPITCGTSTTAGCQASCQLMADCIGENRTVGTVMKPQLADFGFSGTSCTGCVSLCQQNGTGAANAAVLACLQQAQASAQCTGGIEGSFPVMAAVDKCCKGRTDSTFASVSARRLPRTTRPRRSSRSATRSHRNGLDSSSMLRSFRARTSSSSRRSGSSNALARSPSCGHRAAEARARRQHGHRGPAPPMRLDDGLD